MKRKVAQVGPSTLMVSLPIKWVRERGIKKGDEMEVIIGDQEIYYSIKPLKSEEKAITIDITSFDRHQVSRCLEVLYLMNYAKISFTYSTLDIYSDKERRPVNIKSLLNTLSGRFIGMEIISQTKTATELRCFLSDEDSDLNKIEKRISFLFKEMTDEFLGSLKNKHLVFYQNMYEHHGTIAKFIAYYLRVVSKSNKSEEEKNQLYALYSIVSKMVDKFRHINERISNNGCSKRVQDLLQEIFSLNYELLLGINTKNSIAKLIVKRNNLVKQIKTTSYQQNELKIISEARFFLDTFNDFSRVIMLRNIQSLS